MTASVPINGEGIIMGCSVCGFMAQPDAHAQADQQDITEQECKQAVEKNTNVIKEELVCNISV